MIRVTPTAKEPTHHISLTGLDRFGVERTIGLTAIGSDMKPNIAAIMANPSSRTTVKVDTAEGEFVQMKPPFGRLSRSDFSGGLGMLDGDADRTRYAIGRRIWTAGGAAMMAPLLHRAVIDFPATYVYYWNYRTVWTEMDVTSKRYVASYVTCSSTASYTGITIRARLYQSKIKVSLQADSNGEPSGTELASGYSNGTGMDGNVYVEFTTPVTVGAANVWIVVETLASSGDTYDWIGRHGGASGTGAYSADGSTWTAESGDNRNISHVLRTQTSRADDWKFFQYKEGLYAVTSNRLFINGDRGAADDNTGQLTKVIDATKSWTNDVWIGDIVKIVEGPGIGEWRTITDNDGTSLTVDTAWTTPHTTATSYVIQKSPYWTEITGHGITGTVKDVCVTKFGVIYFASGDSTALRRARFYNNSGTWTAAYDNDTASEGASLLLATYDPKNGKPVVWRAQNGTDCAISKAEAKDWGTSLTWGDDIEIGDLERTINGLIDYDEQIAAIKSDGVWLVQEGYAKKTSMNFGSRWGTNIGRRPAIMTPYLVVPFDEKLERMYGTIFEDYGPDVDNGIPDYQNGAVMDTLPVVGGLVIAKAGGGNQDYGTTPGESTVYLHRGGWHPVANLFKGDRLRALTLQRGEDGVDWLWMAGEDGLYYLPFPRVWDYTTEKNFDPDLVEQTGTLVTGWYNGGNLVNDKWWESITLFGNGLDKTDRKIEVWYQLDRLFDSDMSQDSDQKEDPGRWTYAGVTTLNADPANPDNVLSFNIPIRAQGKTVRFLFRMFCDGGADTPKLLGYTVDYLERVSATRTYSLNFRVGDIAYDRAGGYEEYNALDALTLLDYWATTIKPLTMRSQFDPFDQRRVLVEMPGVRPANIDERGSESHVSSISLLDVGAVDEQSPDGLVFAFRRGSTDLKYCPDILEDGASFTAITLPTADNIQDVQVGGDGRWIWMTNATGLYRAKYQDETPGTWGLIYSMDQLYAGAGFGSAVPEEYTPFLKIKPIPGSDWVMMLAVFNGIYPGDAYAEVALLAVRNGRIDVIEKTWSDLGGERWDIGASFEDVTDIVLYKYSGSDEEIKVDGLLSVAGGDGTHPYAYLFHFNWEPNADTTLIYDWGSIPTTSDAISKIAISGVRNTDTMFYYIDDHVNDDVGRKKLYRGRFGKYGYVAGLWKETIIQSADRVFLTAASDTHLMCKGYKSNDGGRTWTADGLSESGTVYEKVALAPMVWVACASDGNVKLTTDFGTTWTTIENIGAAAYKLRIANGG